MADLHEGYARGVKATRLVLTVRSAGHTAEDVACWDDDRRAAVCVEANVRPASPETWAVVLGMLSAESLAVLDAALPVDPFDGLTA